MGGRGDADINVALQVVLTIIKVRDKGLKRNFSSKDTEKMLCP